MGYILSYGLLSEEIALLLLVICHIPTIVRLVIYPSVLVVEC